MPRTSQNLRSWLMVLALLALTSFACQFGGAARTPVAVVTEISTAQVQKTTIAQFSPTPQPSPTEPAPTLLPSQMEKLVLPELVKIDATNFHSLSEVARLGRGAAPKLSWLPNGSAFLVATDAGIWQYRWEDLAPVQFLPTEGAASAIVASPDGKLFSVTTPGKIAALAVSDGQELEVLYVEKALIISQIAFVNGGKTLAVSTQHGSPGLFLLDLPGFKPRTAVVDSQNSVTDLDVTLDGGRVLYCSPGLGYFLWIAGENQGKRIAPLLEDEGTNRCHVAIHPTGTMASVSPDWKSISVVDLSSGDVLATLPKVNSGISAVRFTPDGNLLLISDYTGEITGWDTGTWKQAFTLEVEEGMVSGLAVSPDSKTLLGSNYYGYIHVWDLATQKLVQTLAPFYQEIDSLALSPQDDWVGFGTYLDAHLYQWNLKSGAVTRPLELPNYEPSSIAFSLDGKRMAIGDRYGMVFVASAENFTIRQQHAFSDEQVRDLAFDPGGKWLACLSSNGTLRLLDVSSLEPLLELPNAVPEPGNKLAVSRDGKYLAFAGGGNQARLLNIASRSLVTIYSTSSSGISSVAIDPQSRWLLVFTNKGGMEKFDLPYQQDNEFLIMGINQTVTSNVAYSPTGDLLAYGTASGAVFVGTVDLSDRTEPLTGHNGTVIAVKFSHDGKFLITSGVDGTLRVWGIELSKAN